LQQGFSAIRARAGVAQRSIFLTIKFGRAAQFRLAGRCRWGKIMGNLEAIDTDTTWSIVDHACRASCGRVLASADDA
jgi:hypothetical protein